jgi:hypothetical protein
MSILFEFYLKISILIIISTLVASIPPFAIWLFSRGVEKKEMAVIVITLGVIGACTGVAGGLSRVGAVGSLITAVLGFLGGVSLYLFGLDKKCQSLKVSCGAIALSLSVLTSLLYASELRSKVEDHNLLRKYCIEAYSNPALTSNEQALSFFEKKYSEGCELVHGWKILGMNKNK